MKITPDIRNALERSIEHHGNVTQFAKYLGIAHSTILFWLSGKTTEINGRIWAQKIRPALQPFLDPDFHGECPVPENEPFVPDKVPLFTADELTAFDLTIEPIRDFIDRMKSGREFLFAAHPSPNCFAMEFQPTQLPFKLAVLADGGAYPVNGSIVLTKVRSTGNILLGRLEKGGEFIRIQTFFPPLEEILWNPREQAGFLCWNFPVLEIQSDIAGMTMQQNDSQQL